MRKLIVLLALLAVLVLTGCGWKGTGVVDGKNHQPGYFQTSYQCMGFDKNGSCTLNMPIQTWISDSWYVSVKDDQGKDHWVGVNEDYYDTVKNGDTFSNEDDK